MIFEVNPVLLGIFESVDDPGGDDRILDGLVCLFFEILGEEDIGLNGCGDVQQLLVPVRLSLIKVMTRHDPHLVHLANEFLTLSRLLSELSLLEIVTDLQATLDVGAWQR